MYLPIGILILVLLFLPLDAAFLIGLIFLAFYCFPAFLVIIGIGVVIFLLGGDKKKEEIAQKKDVSNREEKNTEEYNNGGGLLFVCIISMVCWLLIEIFL